MRKTVLLVLMVLMIFSLLSCGGKKAAPSEAGATAAAAPKQTFTLRFGHVLSPNDLPHKHMEEWAENVRKLTDGGLNIEIFPSAQLGSEEDVLEQIRQGANIGWQTDFARLGSYIRELSVPNASYFVNDLDEAIKLLDSPTIKRLNAELAEKFGLAHISFIWAQGPRNVFANKIIKSPDDMKGLLIRTAPAPIWRESINALGCTATPLPYGEIYTGISSKVVDGAELGFSAGYNMKLAEVVKYVMETGHIFLMNSMVVSKTWLDKLPADYQKILIDECNKAGLNSSRAHIKTNEEAKQELIKAGVTVITRDQLDYDAFVKASSQAYEALDLANIRAAIYADIGKK